MQTILVTGAGGYIGRHVADALAGHGQVVRPVVDGQRIDLLQAGAAREVISRTRPDMLVHLAWETEHGRFWTSPRNKLWEDASSTLFEEFFAAGGQRALGLGSCAEYDWTTGAETFGEMAALAPHTAYGAAKVATATALAETAARHGASWAWGRIFFSFGVGEPPGRLVPLMLGAALKGESLGIGPAETVRDIWDVRNLGAAIAALATLDVEGPVNLASGASVSFGDLARLVEKLAGTEGLIRPDSRPLGPGEPMRLVAKVDRLANDIGFVPKVSLEKGLEEYLGALKAM